MAPYEGNIPFVPGSVTSRKAAKRARRTAPTQCMRIKASLAQCAIAGSTRNELIVATGIQNKSLCPRVRELLERGEVVTLKETRPTSAKNDASVLVLPEFTNGREVDPFVKYTLVAVDMFDEAFGEFDAEWRAVRWAKVQALAAPTGSTP